MADNYPSSSEAIRNLSQIPMVYATLGEFGRFRLIDFHPKFCNGYRFWLVNERGFLWEPSDSIEEALAYLDSEEALAYEAED